MCISAGRNTGAGPQVSRLKPEPDAADELRRRAWGGGRGAGAGAFAEDGVTIADPSKIERRPVTLGRGSQDYVEITSGLEEGETVLLPIQSTGGMPSDGSAAVAAAG